LHEFEEISSCVIVSREKWIKFELSHKIDHLYHLDMLIGSFFSDRCPRIIISWMNKLDSVPTLSTFEILEIFLFEVRFFHIVWDKLIVHFKAIGSYNIVATVLIYDFSKGLLSFVSL
jgi:hypothetical protein